MSSADVIDALFVKTVDMVQSLPKAGPIQTSYEEKLALYSLYKQATEGDVQSKRPGMLDMLGRAKWDAWAKVRDLSPRDAKQMYVESMLRILRRFGDRPQAAGLIEELESFSGQVAQRVMDGSLAQRDSDDESADTTEGEQSDPLQSQQQQQQQQQQRRLPAHTPSIAGTSTAATRGGEASVAPGQTPIGSDDDSSSEDGHDRFGSAPLRAGGGGAASSSTMRYQSSVGAQTRPQPRMYQRTNSVGGGGETYVPRGGGPSSVQGSYSYRTQQQPASSGYPRHEPPYQRSNYAASSVGGRSVRTAGGGGGGGGAPMYAMRPASVTGGGGGSSSHHHRMGPPPPRPEMEMALQSIQASLAALHERLNQVENRSPLAGSVDDVRRSRPSASSSSSPSSSTHHWLYNAVLNVVQDVRQLIGLGTSSTTTGIAAPSFLRSGATSSGLGSPLKILIALVNVGARLALDLVSLMLVSSFFLFAWKKISGRGDPLMLLRLLKRAQQAVLRQTPQLVKEISS